jgi:hypothetical protein
VNRVFPGRLGMSKSGAPREIHPDCQPSLARIEIHRLNEPRRFDAKGCLKQLVGHDRCPLPHALAHLGATRPLSEGHVNASPAPQPVELWTARRSAAHNPTGQIKIKQSIGVFSKPLEIQMRQDSQHGNGDYRDRPSRNRRRASGPLTKAMPRRSRRMARCSSSKRRSSTIRVHKSASRSQVMRWSSFPRCRAPQDSRTRWGSDKDIGHVKDCC